MLDLLLAKPIDPLKSTLLSCCSKIICNGCDYADSMSSKGVISCPFCREPLVSEEECVRRTIKRVKANNDPAASCFMGMQCRSKGDYDSAFEYFTKAAELGEAEAHFNLGWMYEKGEGGVEKDMNKAVHHYAEAAIGGHPRARYNLGCLEGNAGSHDRAAKHFIIAAKQGHDAALEKVKKIFTLFKEEELVSKDEYAAALRGHQAAIDATKSELREVAAEQAAQKEADKAS